MTTEKRLNPVAGSQMEQSDIQFLANLFENFGGILLQCLFRCQRTCAHLAGFVDIYKIKKKV